MQRGDVYGRLKALRPGDVSTYRWWFLCSCGTEKLILTDNVVRGRVKSCGCLRREVAATKGGQFVRGHIFLKRCEGVVLPFVLHSSTSTQRRKQAARSRAWYENNKEKACTNRQRRRAALAGVPSTLTAVEWLEILEYFNHACAYCLRTDLPLEQEHLAPVSRGGGTTPENVVPACGSCNRKKKDRGILLMVA